MALFSHKHLLGDKAFGVGENFVPRAFRHILPSMRLQENWQVRKTRSGCGIIKTMRPSGEENPVLPPTLR